MERIKLSPHYGHSIGADVTYEYDTISTPKTTQGDDPKR